LLRKIELHLPVMQHVGEHTMICYVHWLKPAKMQL